MASIGEIYTVEIFFDDDPSKSKLRPVLIINAENNIYTFAEITSTPPKVPPTYFDRFKKPIQDWQKAGLLNASYVKTHKLHRSGEDKLVKYRGKIEGEELIAILTRIVEVNY